MRILVIEDDRRAADFLATGLREEGLVVDIASTGATGDEVASVKLDKFIQVVSLDGRPVARSANLGTAQLPAPPSLLDHIRAGEQVFETLKDFGDEPVRLLSVPLEIAGTAYAIQVAGSLDDAQTAIRSARRLFLAMSVAILGAVALIGAMLTRTAHR